MILGTFCIVLLLSSGSLSAEDADDPTEFTVGDFTYAVQNLGEVMLIGYTPPEADPPSHVKIPNSVTFGGTPWTVTAIGDCAFSADVCGEETKSVFIPETVTQISNRAFESAFLENLEVDSANSSFRSKDGVLFDRLSDTLVRYPPAKADSKYVVDYYINIIAATAFRDAVHLREVTLGKYTFFIEDSAFDGCKNLAKICFDETNVRVIGESAFDGCESLGTLSLPEGLTSIGAGAFVDCKSLSSVTIPSTVTSIGAMVFDGCVSLEKIEVDGDNGKYVIRDCALYEVDADGRYRTLVCFPAACGVTELVLESVDAIMPYAFSHSELKKVVLPFGITNIDVAAMAKMTCLEDIVLPSSVSKIDVLAFSGCTALKSIVLGGNIQMIGYMAFADCVQLESVTFGQEIIEIGSRAFSGTALKSIVLPESLKTLGAEVFKGCKSLTYIQIDSADVSAAGALNMGDAGQNLTVKCYRGALKNLGDVGGNITFEYYGERPFPAINLVGIAVCVLLLLAIFNYLRRI